MAELFIFGGVIVSFAFAILYIVLVYHVIELVTVAKQTRRTLGRIEDMLGFLGSTQLQQPKPKPAPPPPQFGRINK